MNDTPSEAAELTVTCAGTAVVSEPDAEEVPDAVAVVTATEGAEFWFAGWSAICEDDAFSPGCLLKKTK
jgi:hypothetical protein